MNLGPKFSFFQATFKKGPAHNIDSRFKIYRKKHSFLVILTRFPQNIVNNTGILAYKPVFQERNLVRVYNFIQDNFQPVGDRS